jgi:hypothetical protein
LGNAPSDAYYYFGFRACKALKSENLNI